MSKELIGKEYINKIRKLDQAFKNNCDLKLAAQIILAIQEYIKDSKIKKPFEEWDIEMIIDLLQKKKPR